ncbi:MAG: hypothetical protein MJY82_07490 [Fibrobacter sp.]|nr:hypothetical protein [Fibrobacter sp.]
MNKKYFLAVAACSIMFAACSDDVTEIHQNGVAALAKSAYDDDGVEDWNWGTYYKCDNEKYDPEKAFCSEGKTYSCMGKPYNPKKAFCSEGKLFSCDGKPYDPEKAFCSEGKLLSCDDKAYDPEKQYCKLSTTIENYGWLEDSRDKQHVQVYKTVKICNDDETSCQTWMAENLNYSVNPGVQSWCYDNNDSNCNIYGRLYTWAAAVGKTEKECGLGHKCDLSDATNKKGVVRGVCPEGWHLPSHREFEELINYINPVFGYGHTGDAAEFTAGKLLKSRSGWNSEWNYDGSGYNGNGTDAYSFNALPAGYFDSDDDVFSYVGEDVSFWSSTEYDKASVEFEYMFAFKLRLFDSRDKVNLDFVSKNLAIPVRCLQD